MEDYMARIEAANEEFVTGEDNPMAPPPPKGKTEEEVQVDGTFPIDLYQHKLGKRISEARSDFPKGSRSLVTAVAKDMIDGEGGLARAKKRAENDSEVLAAQGYKDRAEIAKQQYMEEKFLPAIESVISYTSPEELLNCKEALSAFDKMALGVGSMSGYTAAYVRQAYGNVLGQNRGISDPTVRSEMQRIRSLVEEDQIRTAIGMAKRLKDRIDSGEHIAEPEDYALLGRIVSYAN